MFHVICTLPNASHEINGLAFKDLDGEEGGVITTDPIDENAAVQFLGINGYRIVDAAAPAPTRAPKAPKGAKAAKADEPVVAQEDVLEPAVEAVPEPAAEEPAAAPVVEAEVVEEATDAGEPTVTEEGAAGEVF